MHTSPRTGPIYKIVIHTNEGPEGDNSAEGLKSYLLNNGPTGGGYQVTFDDKHTAHVQPDSIVCYANGGVNHESVDGCVIEAGPGSFLTEKPWAADSGNPCLDAQWTTRGTTHRGLAPQPGKSLILRHRQRNRVTVGNGRRARERHRRFRRKFRNFPSQRSRRIHRQLATV